MTELLFLGTGTSMGVPVIGCTCPVCTSSDPRDNRLRTSALVSVDGTNILIDCGPDLRTQLLRAGSPRIDAVLLTHSHYDHVGGIDDLRPYCIGKKLRVYCQTDVSRDLHQRVPYCFSEHPYPGVPEFEMHGDIRAGHAFSINGVTIQPVPVMHDRLPILGYRIGSLAYITDCKTISDDAISMLHGIDTLVINALRYKEHHSHMSLAEAMATARLIAPKATYFTHMSHGIGLARETARTLPPGMHLAYDMLKIKTP